MQYIRAVSNADIPGAEEVHPRAPTGVCDVRFRDSSYGVKCQDLTTAEQDVAAHATPFPCPSNVIGVIGDVNRLGSRHHATEALFACQNKLPVPRWFKDPSKRPVFILDGPPYIQN
jgi:hypothetical protein